MKMAFCLPLLAAVAACAGAEPAPKDPSSATAASVSEASGSAKGGAASRQAGDDATRSLDEAECQSLGEWLVDACNNRPNSRSVKIDVQTPLGP